MNNNTAQSILQMARGAFQERCDYEMGRIIENILDVNTKATAKRAITLTISLVPDDTRENISVSVTAKSLLAINTPVTTNLFVTEDEGGNTLIAEMVPNVQTSLFDGEQTSPKILKFIQA
jgi:hypothetical protein